MGNRNNRLHRLACIAGKRLDQPLGDARTVERRIGRSRKGRIGAALLVEAAPVARPQADLAVGLADVDDDGEAAIQIVLPSALIEYDRFLA